MRLILCFIIIATLSISACQKKEEGCMHPRATNFNPEADEDNGTCNYYQLSLEMQHYASGLIDDTLNLGNWIYDVDANPIYLSNMGILASGLHLFRSGSGEEVSSIDIIDLEDTNGNIINAEDNFFIIRPENYSYNITGWTELGNYDSLLFYIGIPSNIKTTSPAKVEESAHPLSTTSLFYMFDSTSLSYKSCRLVLTQPLSGTGFAFDFFDYIPIRLPCNITVVDGTNIPIKLRLNYTTLFNGVSFSNDSHATIQTKIAQNFPAAFSTF